MFRFTIRDVLWLTVVVALTVGWWLERARSQGQARRIERLEAEVQQSGVAIKTFYDDLERIEQALPAYGAGLVWSRDMRPSLSPVSKAKKGTTP
jgi:hypothetical protein